MRLNRQSTNCYQSDNRFSVGVSPLAMTLNSEQDYVCRTWMTKQYIRTIKCSTHYLFIVPQSANNRGFSNYC